MSLPSFTNIKDLVLQRARKLPIGQALESAYVTEVAKKQLSQFFSITTPEKDITHVTYAKDVVTFTVTSAAFANEIKNRETELLTLLKKALPQADFDAIRIKIG